MISKVDLSLWDIFVTFGSGIVSLIFIAFHFFYLGIIDKRIIFYIKEIPSVGFIFILIPVIFIIGIIIDGLAIVISSATIEKIFKIGKPSVFGANLGEIITKKYIPEEIRGNINPYFWCKDYIIQNKLETPFMLFLSKFGFYRNIAFLFYVNFIIFIAYLFRGENLIGGIAILIASVLLGVIFTLRSKKFYYHMEKTIYGNFFVSTQVINPPVLK